MNAAFTKGLALSLSLLLLSTLSACSQRSEPSSSTAPVSSSEPVEWIDQPVIETPDGDTMTEEDILFTFNSMIFQASEVTGIYVGAGLPMDETGTPVELEGGSYLPVQSDAYHTVAQLKGASEQVFTKAYLEGNFYPLAFSNADGSPPRYVEIDGQLHRETQQIGARSGERWDTDTLQIVSREKDRLVISMVYPLPGDEDTRREEIILEREDGNWRFASDI